jgi:exonuclease III
MKHAYMAEDKKHREFGLWAVDTANANAWTSAAEYLKLTSADIVIHQEAKLRGTEKIDSAQSAAKTTGWSCAINGCGAGPAGGPSAGVAVSARQHLGMAEADTDMSDPERKGISHRFIMTKLAAICRRGVHIASVYLHHGVGPKAEANQDILDVVAETLSSINGPWILGGDF